MAAASGTVARCGTPTSVGSDRQTAKPCIAARPGLPRPWPQNLTDRRVDAPFEDIGPQQVKNIDRPIRVWRCSGHTRAAKAAAALRPVNHAQRPTIAGLPFESMGGTSDHDCFADGIAEDITTELSRFGSLTVVSRHSAFKYRGSAMDRGTVGAELGAQFLLSGSVRRSGPRIRVTIQLPDSETGNSGWGERFDRDTEDLFAIQDEITERVAPTAAGQVCVIDTDRAKRKNPDNLQAYDYFLRGLDLHTGGETGPDAARDAVAMFDKAIEQDSIFARTHAWRACSFSRTWVDGRTDTLLEEALTYVKTALSLDAGESEAHRILGAIHLMNRDFERAEKHINRASVLNPNDADIMTKAANF